jgi:hypothetical protein
MLPQIPHGRFSQDGHTNGQAPFVQVEGRVVSRALIAVEATPEAEHGAWGHSG